MSYLSLIRGDSKEQIWTIKDPAGAAYNLTGCTLWFTLKASPLDADNLAVLAQHWVSGGTASGIAVASPVTGIATHTIMAAESAALTAGRSYAYDIQLKDAAGKVTTIESGWMAVERDVTISITVP